MPELRWTLLILGALFIGALAFWEIRRKRHARGQDPNAGGRDSERVTPTLDDDGEESGSSRISAPPERARGDARAHREPTLTFPDVHLDTRGERASVARPPVVEIDDASLADLKIEPHTVVDEFSTAGRSRASDEALGLNPTVPIVPGTPPPATPPLPGTSSTGPRVGAARPTGPSEMPDALPPRGAATPAASQSMWPREPAAPDTSQSMWPREPAAPETSQSMWPRDPATPDTSQSMWPRDPVAAETSQSTWPREPSAPDVVESPTTGGSSHPESSFGEPSSAGENGAPSVGDSSDDDSEVLGPAVVREAAPVSALSPDSFDTPEPIVDWPDESSRKIVALRLVSGTGERFQGRAVRLALAAEGFQIGKFDIFHKPGPDSRAVLSAASLTKPGTFSLATMDGQRYGGLSLFAVLPGPLPAVETFDELLLTARSLNDRLRGALQDERGEPLTPVRSASIRESLASSSIPTSH